MRTIERSFAILIVLLLFISCSSKDDEPCINPSGLTVSTAYPTRVELRWYVGNDAPSYTVEYGRAGFSLGSGNQFTVAGGFKNLTGLQPDTEYQAYIRSNCSDSKVSEFSRPFNFWTKP